MRCAYLAFTEKGLALARRLAKTLPGSVSRCGAGEGRVSLADWTAAQFARSEALIFVGAAGIAVRAIAPHCRSKAADPAVVVLDECGRFAISLLSGHLGGANALAAQLAAACGAVPVITTATDANGLFAVDSWAKANGCAVLEPERIKHVSGALLAGESVYYASDFDITGTPPRGVGCKRGTDAAQLEAAFAAFCACYGLAPAGITAAASIDLKQNEPGLAVFCAAHGWPVTFYTAEQLRGTPGDFTPSAFVARVTGVDNVCERAAVRAAGGPLVCPKFAGGGVTLALAARPFALDWRK